MSLNTHSRFYYGFDVDSTNSSLDFSEGGPELQATLRTGSYTLSEFVVEIERALDAAGGQDYSVSVARATRKITISAPGVFELLVSTGSRVGSSVYGLAGFSGADKTGASSYVGGSGAGSEYSTQFVLQSFISSEDWRSAAEAVVNKSASGRVEVITFGTEKFTEFEFIFVTDIVQSGGPIRNNATGVIDLRNLLRFMTTKATFEFMPDEDAADTFESLILESSPSEKDGVGYRLRELFDRGLPGYYQIGPLKFRVIE